MLEPARRSPPATAHTVVLRDVDIVVPDGRVVALIGPNGAGKTTLLRVASGLLRPQSGRCSLDGRDVTGQPPHRASARSSATCRKGGASSRRSRCGTTCGSTPRLARSRDSVDRAVDAFPRLGERLDQLGRHDERR